MTDSCRMAARGRRGFTLIELLAVLTLVAITLTLAVPHINVTRYTMDTAAHATREALQFAQRLSLTRQYDVIVSFDTVNARIRIVEDANNNSTVDAGERVYWRSLEGGARFAVVPVGVSGTDSAAVTGPALETMNGMPSIVFRRDGAASSDLTVYLTSPHDQSTDRRAIRLDGTTAHTSWFRFTGTSWREASL